MFRLQEKNAISLRMSQFNHVLMSIAKSMGCTNVFDLLEVVRCRRWYPDGEHYLLTEDDVQVMGDFDRWVTGKVMRSKPTLNPRTA